MTVEEARGAARQWILEHSRSIPGFLGAYTAGSANWLPDDATLPPTSDFDVIVVVHDAGLRRKFLHRGVLLEISTLAARRLASPDLVLSDYHLAPSLGAAHILLDPSGALTALAAAVRRDYAKRAWVLKRCAQARDKILTNLRSMSPTQPLHDHVMAWLFATGITTHVLLAAGLRNPTVRNRYVAVRELLAQYGRPDVHQALLELLGSARLTPHQVRRHVSNLAGLFDAAAQHPRPNLPFAADLTAASRPIAIDGSLDLIARGLHREAMFWIAVTETRCRKTLSVNGPTEVLADLGVPTLSAVQNRSAELEQSLPRVWEVAESIVAANPAVEEN